MSTLTTVVAVLFGCAVLGALVTAIVSGVRRARRTGTGDQPHESAQHTVRTAIPWLLMFLVLLVVILGAYLLMH